MELVAIVLALKQWFHLLRAPRQVHLHPDNESLRYLQMCPRPLTPRQACWSHFFEEYDLTLWYVPVLKNPAADACSRITSRQLMNIENATGTQPFMLPSVNNWGSPEGEPVDAFPHVFEDSFFHYEVWLQPYHHLYVSLRSGRPVERDPDFDADAEPALKFDTEPAVESEELKPLPTNEVVTEYSHWPAAHLDDARNVIPDKSTDPDDLPFQLPLAKNFNTPRPRQS